MLWPLAGGAESPLTLPRSVLPSPKPVCPQLGYPTWLPRRAKAHHPQHHPPPASLLCFPRPLPAGRRRQSLLMSVQFWGGEGCSGAHHPAGKRQGREAAACKVWACACRNIMTGIFSQTGFVLRLCTALGSNSPHTHTHTHTHPPAEHTQPSLLKRCRSNWRVAAAFLTFPGRGERRRKRRRRRKGMGGLEQLHPLLPARSWAWGGQEGQKKSRRRQAQLQTAFVSERHRETEIRRERKKKREGEREREQAPGLGVGGSAAQQPPQQPVAFAPLHSLPWALSTRQRCWGLRGGPWGSGIGKGAYLTDCSNMCPCGEALPGSWGGFLATGSQHPASH